MNWDKPSDLNQRPLTGWRRDRDGWLYRPARPADSLIKLTGCHAFIEAGRLYCRNNEQAQRLDKGKGV